MVDPIPTPQATANKSSGPVIGIVIIVVVLVLGGLYFWGERIVNEQPTPEEIIGAPDQTLENLNMQGTSDEINAIESDLNATNLQNLDSEVRDIESELGNL